MTYGGSFDGCAAIYRRAIVIASLMMMFSSAFSARAAVATAAQALAAIEPPTSIGHEREPDPPWLERLNYFRALTDEAAVDEDARLTYGDWKHAIYLVK